MTVIPAQLPGPVLCTIHIRRLTDGREGHVTSVVAAFTDLDALVTEAPEGEGVPLLVTDNGLRTPAQLAHDLEAILDRYAVHWMERPNASGGLVIANDLPTIGGGVR